VHPLFHFHFVAAYPVTVRALQAGLVPFLGLMANETGRTPLREVVQARLGVTPTSGAAEMGLEIVGP
jgi:hypothetical protein